MKEPKHDKKHTKIQVAPKDSKQEQPVKFKHSYSVSVLDTEPQESPNSRAPGTPPKEQSPIKVDHSGTDAADYDVRMKAREGLIKEALKDQRSQNRQLTWGETKEGDSHAERAVNAAAHIIKTFDISKEKNQDFIAAFNDFVANTRALQTMLTNPTSGPLDQNYMLFIKSFFALYDPQFSGSAAAERLLEQFDQEILGRESCYENIIRSMAPFVAVYDDDDIHDMAHAEDPQRFKLHKAWDLESTGVLDRILDADERAKKMVQRLDVFSQLLSPQTGPLPLVSMLLDDLHSRLHDPSATLAVQSTYKPARKLSFIKEPLKQEEQTTQPVRRGSPQNLEVIEVLDLENQGQEVKQPEKKYEQKQTQPPAPSGVDSMQHLVTLRNKRDTLFSDLSNPHAPQGGKTRAGMERQLERIETELKAIEKKDDPTAKDKIGPGAKSSDLSFRRK